MIVNEGKEAMLDLKKIIFKNAVIVELVSAIKAKYESKFKYNLYNRHLN